MLNRFIFLLIIFHYALFAYSQSPVINEGMSYILSIDRTEVKDDDIIINYMLILILIKDIIYSLVILSYL